jgi:hypothetical protein
MVGIVPTLAVDSGWRSISPMMRFLYISMCTCAGSGHERWNLHKSGSTIWSWNEFESNEEDERNKRQNSIVWYHKKMRPAPHASRSWSDWRCPTLFSPNNRHGPPTVLPHPPFISSMSEWGGSLEIWFRRIPGRERTQLDFVDFWNRKQPDLETSGGKKRRSGMVR